LAPVVSGPSVPVSIPVIVVFAVAAHAVIPVVDATEGVFLFFWEVSSWHSLLGENVLWVLYKSQVSVVESVTFGVENERWCN